MNLVERPELDELDRLMNEIAPPGTPRHVELSDAVSCAVWEAEKVGAREAGSQLLDLITGEMFEHYRDARNLWKKENPSE